MKKILIIEDDNIKIEKLSIFFEQYDFTVKESYHSGLTEILNPNVKYDFLILDMTIPLWDKGNTDLGGNYEQFGGERILREMKRRKKNVPTVLVSMFDVFPMPSGNLTFEELDNHLKSEFSQFYVGGVFYNATEENKWKNELQKLINEIDDKKAV